MKKIERLQWIERTYGAEFVSPYRVARNKQEILDALIWHWDERLDWRPGIRTDWRAGAKQGYSLPFLYPVDELGDAWDLYDQWGDALDYIVSGSVQPVLLQGVMFAVDGGAIVEINDKEPETTQRHMYRFPENVRHFGISDDHSYVWFNNRPVRAFRPEQVQDLRLQTVFDCLPLSPERELTFSVRQQDRSVVIW